MFFRLRILSSALTLVLSVSLLGQTRTDSIRSALEYQRSNYPASEYRDVYKNFMQDYYGPGHLLNDTVAASRYLRAELEGTEIFGGPDYEPTGFEGNFMRVNLRLIREGIIPFPVFFRAFVESVQDIVPPDGETWLKVWKEIDDEIIAMQWTFPNEAQDRSALGAQFIQGNYIAHHSEAFNRANNFHYRIISRDNFDRYIRPFITR